LDRRIEETYGTPKEWHYRAVQDGACAVLAALHMDERRKQRLGT